jgi:hypothetical protein
MDNIYKTIAAIECLVLMNKDEWMHLNSVPKFYGILNDIERTYSSLTDLEKIIVKKAFLYRKSNYDYVIEKYSCYFKNPPLNKEVSE